MIRETTVRSGVGPADGSVPSVETKSVETKTTPSPTRQVSDRDAGLDFVKGALVLLMILYHWLNYFVSVHGFGYAYIRFITPSFVFLAGFLVTNLLATRASQNSSRLATRLFIRGFKLLVLFTVLNLGVAWLEPTRPSGRSVGLDAFIENFPACYLTARNTFFFILVPIGYTLILAALLQKIRDLPRCRFLASGAVVVIAGGTLVLLGAAVPTLELVGAGLLGLILGGLLNQRLHHLSRVWTPLAIAYVLHIGALTVWGVPYALQLVSVCLNLGLLYCLAHRLPPVSVFGRLMALLGQYTLLGYVGQLAILQLLVIAFRRVDLGPVEPALALVLALLLTSVAIAGVDFIRHRSRLVDLAYRFVFA